MGRWIRAGSAGWLGSVPETAPRRSPTVGLAWGFALVCLVVVVGLAWWRGSPTVEDRPDVGTEAATAPVSLALPEAVQDYRLDASEQARDYAQQAEGQLEEQSPGARALVGTYDGPGGSVVVVGLAVDPGSDQGAALAADPGSAVRGYLRQVEVPGPRRAGTGAVGGALLCGRPRHEGSAADNPVTCAWGTVTGLLVTLSISGAAAADAPATSRVFIRELTLKG